MNDLESEVRYAEALRQRKNRSVFRKITIDGLLWGTGKLVAIGYGIKKLQITTVVEDDKVSTEDLEDQITALEDYVQSVDIVAFNKI
jgi:translation elongation factor EF-1beta